MVWFWPTLGKYAEADVVLKEVCSAAQCKEEGKELMEPDCIICRG